MCVRPASQHGETLAYDLPRGFLQEPFVTFQVGPEDVAPGVTRLRLDAFLANSLPSSSRAQIQEAIKQGGVTVNGAKAGKAALALKAGDVICCTLPSPAPVEALPEVIQVINRQTT